MCVFLQLCRSHTKMFLMCPPFYFCFLPVQHSAFIPNLASSTFVFIPHIGLIISVFLFCFGFISLFPLPPTLASVLCSYPIRLLISIFLLCFSSLLCSSTILALLLCSYHVGLLTPVFLLIFGLTPMFLSHFGFIFVFPPLWTHSCVFPSLWL